MIVALASTTPHPSWNHSALPDGNEGSFLDAVGPGDEQQFQQHKVEFLKHLCEHLVIVQNRISCVEAASTTRFYVHVF